MLADSTLPRPGRRVAVAEGARLSIAASWNRARKAHVNPWEFAPHRIDVNPDDFLLRAAKRVLPGIEGALIDTTTWVGLTNAEGVVTYAWGSSLAARQRWATSELGVGASLAESSAGTNGVGLALATQAPSLVRGAEHFIEPWDDFVCAAVPIRHPTSQQILGVVNVSSLTNTENQHVRIALKSLNDAIRMSLASEVRADHRRLFDAHVRTKLHVIGSVVTVSPDMMIVEGKHGFLAPDRSVLWSLIEDAGPRATGIVLPDGRRVQLLPIDPDDLRAGCIVVFPSSGADQPGAGLSSKYGPIELAEREVIAAVLQDLDGNKAEAAHRLRISRGTLYERLRRYDLIDHE